MGQPSRGATVALAPRSEQRELICWILIRRQTDTQPFKTSLLFFFHLLKTQTSSSSLLHPFFFSFQTPSVPLPPLFCSSHLRLWLMSQILSRLLQICQKSLPTRSNIHQTGSTPRTAPPGCRGFDRLIGSDAGVSPSPILFFPRR